MTSVRRLPRSPGRSRHPARLGTLALLLAVAPLAPAQFPWRRVTPTPVPEAAPAPTVRRAQRVTPAPKAEITEDGVPVRPAERVGPRPGEDYFSPDDPISRALEGGTAPGGRRPTPTPITPQMKRPAEPGPAAAAGADDGTTIRISPGAAGETATPETVQFELANNFFARKQWAQAAAEYEKFLSLSPGAAERQPAFYRLGECYRNLNRMPAATTAFRNLIVEAGERGDFLGPAHYRLAVIHYNEKDFRSSLPLFQRSALLAKASDVKLASLYYAALCLENLDRRIETREIYERIVEISGENPYRDYARLSLARQAYTDGRRSESFRQFEALARDASKESLRVEGHLKAGVIAADLLQWDAALRNLQMVIDWPNGEATAAQRSDARLGQFRILYRTNKYKELIAGFQAHGSALTPENRSEAMLLSANSLRQVGQPQDALALYDQLLKEFPKSPQAADVAYQRVVTLYASSDPKLEAAAEKFLASNPEPERADKVRLIKAEVLFKKEKYPEAAGAYLQVQESSYIEPKYRAEAAYRVGYCFAQLKLPDKVIEAFSRFLRAYPDSALAPKALAQRGLAYQQFRNFPAALQDFNALLSDFPKAKERELALRQKALLLGQVEDPKGMVETFKILLREFPQSSSAGVANFWVGRTAFEAKNYKDAVPSLTAAMADAEYKNKAWLFLILSYFNAEDKGPLEARTGEYMKAGIQPAIPAQVLNYLGSYLFETRKYDRAEPYLAAAADSPQNTSADAWLLVARCRLFLKDWPGAKAAAEKYLATKPVLAAAQAQGYLAVGEAFVGQGNFVEAQKSADQALNLQAEGRLNAEARLLMGQIALAKGDALEAAKAFMSVAVLYDDPDLTPRALSLAVEAYRKAGKTAEAKKAEDELRTRFPSFAVSGP